MRTRAALIVAGAGIMAYAVVGALGDPGLEPAGVLLFLVGVLAAHDAVWMPGVLAVGVALTRLVPQCRRRAARTAAIGRRPAGRKKTESPGPGGAGPVGG